MTGVSLPFAWLQTGEGALGNRAAFLEKLKLTGAKSVEIRTVRPHADPKSVSKAANLLWSFGFQITIHGQVISCESAVEDIFAPLSSLLGAMRQKQLTVTIHPIVGDNAAMLTKLSDYIAENRLSVTIALENNRLLPDGTEGDSTVLVLDAVKKANRDNVGICFDMGHYRYYRLKNHPESPDELPDREFLKRVVHTHIHALNGLTTHFPLGKYELPLSKYLYELTHHYFGVYNIELDDRIEKLCDLGQATLDSVTFLNNELPHTAKLYDEIRKSFHQWLASASAVLHHDHTGGTAFGLIHSSSYLFNTNGYKWAMDIAFRNARFLADDPSHFIDSLRGLDLMVITHEHADHFEESTIKALACTDVKWVIPDFLTDAALARGIRKENMFVAREGVPLTAGKLTFLPFKGRHFRPGTMNGVKEYGYYVTAENSASMVFPVDVRDLSLDNWPDIPKADYCFANVWLGDLQCMNKTDPDIVTAFAKFMLKLSDKNILLTHLYENGREDASMWRSYHAALIVEEIARLSPDTAAIMPLPGEVLELK